MKKIIIVLILCSFSKIQGQIAYDHISNKKVSVGSYGRVGVDWSFDNGRTIGRRLNLNNMGSIGGRMEEQDYLEIAPSFHFTPKEGDETKINAQVRFSLFSNSLTTFANSSTSSLGGLTLAIPEMFVQARNIAGKDLNIWIGARLYRGPDAHLIDHFYFNDHSGQGFGIEYKKTRYTQLFVSSTDTTATVPPYFYLNIKTGTPSTALRQRMVYILEHDIDIDDSNRITLLGEYHNMPDGDFDVEIDSIEQRVNFPSDKGFVIGARWHKSLKKMKKGSFNDLTIRYGSGIANGGDGGLSRTWLTYGAPNLESLSFKKAYSLAIVNHAVLNLSSKNTLNPYLVLTSSKGAANTNHIAETYFGREVFNRKLDITIGARDEIYFSDFFHLATELHYSQRKDGTNPTANVTKLSIVPIYVPTGKNNVWARPHLRFVCSIARYNDYAKESLYSPYLEFTGPKTWGTYFGVKAEWWIWN
ncbi:carbohydrate porin [Cognatitamlana onchidii]|uniref:carbohydrate porin n=1 Tax=Cognatitamlana onchidii TaxID=2562860 RepID=UPI0010A61BEB|nr:carbohydrate porin [Algibacter onchidii]